MEIENVCKRCGAELPPGANFCPACGRAAVIQRGPKKRGNGQGTIKALDNGKYMLTVTLGYYTDEQGKRHRKTRSKVYDRRRDAVAGVQDLQAAPSSEQKKSVTFKQLYDAWLPTHNAGKSTLSCYKSAIGFFRPVWGMRMEDITIDDLQECVDACPKSIVKLIPEKQKIMPACSSLDKGGQVMKLCKVGCIGCMKCQRECPADAITVVNNLATVDPAKCIQCGHCADICPRHIINYFGKDYYISKEAQAQ